MKYKNQNKNSLVIIIVIVNLFTVGYFWYFIGFFGEENKVMERKKPPLNVIDYFEKELNLNSNQKEIFTTLRDQHFLITNKLNREQHELKRMILMESFKAVPDTILINSATQTIGAIQTKLEKKISNHFLELRAVCTEEQQGLLNKILKKIHIKIDEKRNKEKRISLKNEELKMEINNLHIKGPQVPRGEHKNPLREIIGNLPDEKKENAKELLKSLTESERLELKTELDSFKSIADNMSPEERAEGVYEILHNLFGDKLEDNKKGDHLIDKYI